MAGVLTLHRLPVRSAAAVTEGTMALEEYELDDSLVGVPPDWPLIESDVAAALEDPLGLDRRLASRGTATRRRRPVSGPVVIFDNDASDAATVMEVRAPNGRGVLYRIARAIATAGHDVVSAKVLTLGDEVVDTFYLRQADTGSKLVDAATLDRLEETILTELQRPW
jgi:[protein-PII] uridylyltransferase